MDLESTNGTFLNGERIESQRYYELREQDVVKFGLSTREFVLLHEESADWECSQLLNQDLYKEDDMKSCK
jgi:smad nuclear-interacting protein 1